jgi:MFS family permease
MRTSSPDDAPSQPRRAGFGQRDLQVVFGVTLMAVLGVSSITPALPEIVDAFGLTRARVGLLVTVFTVPGVFLTPVLGVAADRFGRKPVLVPSLLVFGLAGSACAFAPGFGWLLALRTLQGCGAAALGALNVTLVGDLFRGPERTRAMGLNASVLSVGTASYPALGGVLALIGWRYPFALPLLALPVAWVVAFVLEAPRPEGHAALGSYLRAVVRRVWNGPVALLLVAAVATFILLFGPLLTYVPLLLGRSFGTSPLAIGLVVSSQSIATALTSPYAGRLSARFGARRLIATAFVLYGLGLATLPLVPGPWWALGSAALFGIGQGINLPVLLTLLTGAAPTEQRAAFMAVSGTVLRLGQSLGPLVAGGVDAWLGLRAVFAAGTVLALLVAGILALGLRLPDDVSDGAPAG